MNNVVPFDGQKQSAGFTRLKSPPLAEGILSSFTSLIYRGRQWALRHGGKVYPIRRPDDGTPSMHVDVIIVGASPHVSKTYYPNAWTEDSVNPPTCASIKGDKPDAGVPEPQSQTCALCPNNVFTDLPNGRRGMACQSHKRLAVLLLPEVSKKTLGGPPLVEPVYLKIPPGSFGSFKGYSDWLDHYDYVWSGIITRLTFEDVSVRQFQINFQGIKLLDEKWEPIVLPMMEGLAVQRILGQTVTAPQIEHIPEPVADEGLLEAFSGQAQTPQPQSPSPPPPPPRAAAPAAVLPPLPSPPPARRKSGRPATVVPSPKQMLEASMPPQPSPPPARPVAMVEDPSDDLDQEVADLLAQKVSNMLS